MTEYDDHYARWSYEQLLLQQPHVKFDGLWRVGYRHYIVCADLEAARTVDGERLAPWFDRKCRTITAAVEIVTEFPEGAARVPERSSEDRVLLAGAPRNLRKLTVDLGLELPREFPPFAIDSPGRTVTIVTSTDLFPDEVAAVRSAYASLGYANELEYAVESHREPESENFRSAFGQGDIDLLPRRRMGKYAEALRNLVEDDEQFWLDNRSKVLTTFHTSPESLLPDGWSRDRDLSCLVDSTVFKPANIRTYLTLYQTVYLALPLEEKFDEACSALACTADELSKLAAAGRLKFLLPQAVDRYPAKWLSAVSETAPDALLFSRRLASATISDARRRIPFLYPPLSPRERYSLLNAVADNAEALVGGGKAQDLVRFLAEIGNRWSNAEWSVQARGATGTSHLGIGGVAAAVYEQITGRDLRLELWAAAQKVEWAAALGSHVFPATSTGYDEANACELIAGIYCTSRRNAPTTVPSLMIGAVPNLLTIDNSISVVEFSNEFASSDINRLRSLIHGISSEVTDSAELDEALTKFNAEVRHYERRPNQLNSLNLIGLLSATAAAAGAVPESVQTTVPLAGHLAGYVVNRILDEAPRYLSSAGTVIDFLNSALTFRARPDVVLVARARREIKNLKR